MVGPDGLLCAPLELHGRSFASLTGDTPVSPSSCSRTNPSLVRVTITYHNKNLPQGEVFIMVGPDGLEPTTRPL